MDQSDVVVVQLLSCVWLFVTPWTAACQAPLSSSSSSPLGEVAQIHVHWVGDDIQPSHALPPPYSLAFNLSQHQGLFHWVSSSHQVAKHWNFSFSISPSNEYSGFISFEKDSLDLDLLAIRGLKSILEHHSSKASILQCSALFIIQVSHPYMTTGKNIALTRQTFVGN